tara:strand:+ start:1248 stop:2213 length:966 start_codon:yes stop_codon:yes gene_type:complete
MNTIPKTLWVLDLGSWAVRLLRVQILNGQLLNWDSFEHVHQTSIQETLNFKQGYLQKLPAAVQRLIERSGVRGPIHVLLPSSIFNYNLDSESGINLKIDLNENVRQEINLLLDKQGLEAAFLGSGISAEIEYLRNKKYKRSNKIFLLSLNYSASYFVEIKNGKLKNFLQDTSINGMKFDSMMQNSFDFQSSTHRVLDWKKNKFALLPVYRPLQLRLPDFSIIKDFLDVVSTQLDQWESNESSTTIFLSGGVTQLRNFDAYLEGTRANQYESFCTSFFNKWLENTTLGSDNQNGWSACFAHAALIIHREKNNVEPNKKTPIE